MIHTTEFTPAEFAKLQALSKKLEKTIDECLRGFAETCFPGDDWKPAGHPNQVTLAPTGHDGKPTMCRRTEPEPVRNTADIQQVVSLVTGGPPPHCMSCGMGVVFGRLLCGRCEDHNCLPMSAMAGSSAGPSCDAPRVAEGAEQVAARELSDTQPSVSLPPIEKVALAVAYAEACMPEPKPAALGAPVVSLAMIAYAEATKQT